MPDADLTVRVNRQFLRYDFPLTRDIVTSISLPVDLTPDEAKRLAAWLLILPFANCRVDGADGAS